MLGPLQFFASTYTLNCIPVRKKRANSERIIIRQDAGRQDAGSGSMLYALSMQFLLLFCVGTKYGSVVCCLLYHSVLDVWHSVFTVIPIAFLSTFVKLVVSRKTVLCSLAVLCSFKASLAFILLLLSGLWTLDYSIWLLSICTRTAVLHIQHTLNIQLIIIHRLIVSYIPEVFQIPDIWSTPYAQATPKQNTSYFQLYFPARKLRIAESEGRLRKVLRLAKNLQFVDQSSRTPNHRIVVRKEKKPKKIQGDTTVLSPWLLLLCFCARCMLHAACCAHRSCCAPLAAECSPLATCTPLAAGSGTACGTCHQFCHRTLPLLTGTAW